MFPPIIATIVAQCSAEPEEFLNSSEILLLFPTFFFHCDNLRALMRKVIHGGSSAAALCFSRSVTEPRSSTSRQQLQPARRRNHCASWLVLCFIWLTLVPSRVRWNPAGRRCQHQVSCLFFVHPKQTRYWATANLLLTRSQWMSNHTLAFVVRSSVRQELPSLGLRAL